MNNKTIESATKIEQEEAGNYLQLFLYRAPEENNEAIAKKNLKEFIPSFKERGARVEYYQLGKSETEATIDSAKENCIDVLDSIAKAISTAEGEEEVWIELTATMTVTDATGQTASDSTQVTVQPAPTTEPPPTNETGGNRSEISNRISVQIQPPGCTSISDAEHWNKIVFRITSDPTGRIDSSLINTELEVLERVNDGTVLNVKDIVLYSIVNEPGTLLPQLTFEEAERLEIEIMDVEYALICFTS